jgi:hypothetical protein
MRLSNTPSNKIEISWFRGWLLLDKPEDHLPNPKNFRFMTQFSQANLTGRDVAGSINRHMHGSGLQSDQSIRGKRSAHAASAVIACLVIPRA